MDGCEIKYCNTQFTIIFVVGNYASERQKTYSEIVYLISFGMTFMCFKQKGSTHMILNENDN